MTQRKTVLYSTVGSSNYNLTTPESDVDCKEFVLPTFDDLYSGKRFSGNPTPDHSIHDIRQLIDLWYKANINFIEIAYSVNNVTCGNEIMEEILSHKKEIVRMNLPYLFNACGGMFINKMKLLDKGTANTQHLVDKFGYDTKQAMHSYRVLNFIARFAATNFDDFSHAVRYYGSEREFMLGIKNGMMKRDEFVKFVTDYEENCFKRLKDRYRIQPVNEKLKENLEGLVMQMVREEILR